VYARWNIYTAAVLQEGEGKSGQKNVHKEMLKKKFSNVQMPKYLSEKTQTEIFQEWTNYCGFLCALSGVCLKVPAKAKDPKAVGQVRNLFYISNRCISPVLSGVVLGHCGRVYSRNCGVGDLRKCQR